MVYIANQEVDITHELYGVPITGGTPVKLSASVILGDNHAVDDFWISPDSRRVVFRANPVSLTRFDLFSVPLSGGQAVQLNHPPQGPSGTVERLVALSPDGSRVVYLANPQIAEGYNLYSVPAAGGTPQKLNGPLVAGGDVRDFCLSPDGSRVVYTADQATDGLNELYAAPLAGGAWVQLNPALPAGAGGVTEPVAAVSAGSRRVVYTVDLNGLGYRSLYSVPITGGTAVQLNTMMDYHWDAERFRLAPDGSRVVFQMNLTNLGYHELYSVPTAGGNWVRLNNAYGADGSVDDFRVSLDGRRVIYRAYSQGLYDLFSAPLQGGSPLALRPDWMPPPWSMYRFAISPTSRAVIYRADQEVRERFELFMADNELQVYLPVVRR